MGKQSHSVTVSRDLATVTGLARAPVAPEEVSPMA